VREELVYKAALPDPGFTHERDELRLVLLTSSIERVSKER
jgi:hypothetical protein